MWAFSSCVAVVGGVSSLLWSSGSVVVAHGLNCSVERGIFPDRGSKLCPLHCKLARHKMLIKQPISPLMLAMLGTKFCSWDSEHPPTYQLNPGSFCHRQIQGFPRLSALGPKEKSLNDRRAVEEEDFENFSGTEADEHVVYTSVSTGERTPDFQSLERCDELQLPLGQQTPGKR
ncbi:hypothetical protein MJG53_011165 [Ovis ammon polii x Ovis aries]|uniref:Uncharacterized protein n=1 Tax=Ovis ammon polii x Ovis aries TaxID=2918886 RepID=A0ACB9URW4_9CETA|nr:hypothetical protein MJG53_011165 [Ovis ammon polii x Ovis aries]